MEEDTTRDWKTLNSEVVYDNAWIKVTHSEVISPPGNPGIYGKVHFKNVAIGIIPVDEEGNTWVVGQKRYPLNTYTWEIPEGGAPHHEDPLEAAKRELSEEVNLAAENWTLIQEADLSNSVTDERCMIYLATGISEKAGQTDPTESLRIQKIPLKTLFDWVKIGKIRDSLSVMGAMRLELMGIF